MAGTDSRFNSAAFRDAIHFAMQMAKPGTTQDQLRFVWTDRNTYAQQGPASAPFDWTDSPATSHHWGPVTVAGAYVLQYSGAESTETPLGTFDQPTLVVTLLDDDYPHIFDDQGVRADLIELPDRSMFEVMFEAPPVALFDVTVHTIYAKAMEAS